MLGTLAIMIGASTVFFAVLLKLMGSLNIIFLAALVALFNIAQWLFAPYLINAVYKVKEVKPTEFPKLHAMIDKLSRKSGIKKPKLGVAAIPVPNAFAYGSPLTGNRVAITQGLLDTLEEEEVEAVLGHELGHLKHRDVQIMMMVSFLPSLVGMASMAMYFVLLLFTLALSRLREYYADHHSALIVEDGPRKLSEGLAKIVSKTRRIKHQRQKIFMFNGFKPLFISDPDNVEKDIVKAEESLTASSDRELVNRLLQGRVTTTERLMELFSTHPNITRRLKALKVLESSKGGIFSG
jgi:heat shock protein HtpX